MQGRAFLFSTDSMILRYDLEEDSFLGGGSDLEELPDFDGFSDLEELSALEELSNLEVFSALEELSDFGVAVTGSFFFPSSGFLPSVDFIFCE